jgi:hypothetical protein
VSERSTSFDLAPEIEVLFREARRRRRRRWIVGSILITLLVAVIGVALFDSFGGARGGNSNVFRSGPPAPARIASGSQTAPAGVGVVGRGPTAIDFSDSLHGWIASGGVGLPTGNPTIVRTTDGGLTWERTSVPNLSAQAINSVTDRAFGGLVGIHFSSALTGWFFQSGIGWQTNDGGSRWDTMHFPVSGSLVALTSWSHDVWALVDSCPISATSCAQALGKGTLFHAPLAPTLRWHQVGRSVAAGTGTLYASERQRVLVSVGPFNYRRSVGGRSAGSVSTGCESEGPLSGGRLAGLCGGADGGDPAVAISDDDGSTWHRIANGPPPSRYYGWSLTTNGVNTIFYVTGEQTLWRLTAGSRWQNVLQAPSGSDDLIAPIYVTGTHGYALVSNGLPGQWYETKDDGLHWEPVATP